jgi:reactive chlorine resistance protein C
MTTLMQDTAHEKRAMSSQVEAVGRELTRYGLVVVVGWIGLMKFTTYEAEGIRPFVANSPLMSWVYGPLSVRGFSALLGVVEVAVALLIAARPLLPRVSAFGSALAVGMFLTTLSFLITTPGVWEPSLGGFPALAHVAGRAGPGHFLIKDLALLGISLWTLGEAWKASEQRALGPRGIRGAARPSNSAGCIAFSPLCICTGPVAQRSEVMR